jgi:hypothetical protein
MLPLLADFHPADNPVPFTEHDSLTERTVGPA